MAYSEADAELLSEGFLNYEWINKGGEAFTQRLLAGLRQSVTACHRIPGPLPGKDWGFCRIAGICQPNSGEDPALGNRSGHRRDSELPEAAPVRPQAASPDADHSRLSYVDCACGIGSAACPHARCIGP